MKELEDSLLRAFHFLLLVALCFFAADLTAAAWERRLTVKPRPITPPNVVNPNSTQIAPPPGLTAVLSSTGNGQTQEPQLNNPTPVAGQAVVSAAPVNMTLKGTLAGQGMNLAMIDINGNTSMLGVGESISGFTLVSVGPYSATLKNGGQTKTLEMRMARIPSRGGVVAPPPQPTQPVVPQKQPTKGPSIVPAPDQNVKMSQQEFNQLIDAAPPGSLQLRRIQRDDEVIGVQVKILDSAHPLARLGILDNDVVTSVNDEKLSGPESLASVYRILRNSPQLRFQLERNGQRQTLNVDFAD